MLVLSIVLLVQLVSLQCEANEFPLTHPKIVELSAIKHLTKNLPMQIRCAAFKDKLREVAVLDDGSLLRLTIESIENKRVPFRNSEYLLSDLKECKRLLGPTGELQGEALAYAKLREANREIEELKEKLRMRDQSKEGTDRPIDSVAEQMKLAYKLMGEELFNEFQGRCYVYFILFGKQRPLSRNDIETVVRIRSGLNVFTDVSIDSSTKLELSSLSQRLVLENVEDCSYPALELGTCMNYVKSTN